jgi:hypothetical protein
MTDGKLVRSSHASLPVSNKLFCCFLPSGDCALHEEI